MAQNKSGLHKKISSIFDGTPVPKITDGQQSSSATPPDSKGHLPQKPLSGTSSFRQAVMVPATVPKSSAARQSRPDMFSKTSKQSVPAYIGEKLSSLKLGQFADKQKIRILIIPILAIVLIVVLYRNFTGLVRPMLRPPEVQNIKNEPDIAEPPAAVITWQKPELYPMFMRDPTQLSAVGSYAAGVGSIAVKGIVYSDDKPSVVIGSEIMHEGETVGGATIVKINNDSVEFSMDGKTWTQKVQ